MVAWDKAKGKSGSGDAKREIIRMPLPSGNGEIKIRLVGDVLPRYSYWIVTKENKKLPLDCLAFDRSSETFDYNKADPFKEIPEGVYTEKPQFAYVCNVIDKRDGTVKLFDLRSTIYKQIVDYASNSEYGNPADPENGYDLTIKKEKTGPLPQNVKYTVIPARSSSALTEEQKALELYNLDAIFKQMTYDEQKTFLLKNTNLFSDESGDEFRSSESVDDIA